MRCEFVAKLKISPYLFKFGFKVFRSFLRRKRVPTLYVSDHKQRSYWEFQETICRGLPSYTNRTSELWMTSALLPSAFGLVQQCHRVIHIHSGVIILTAAQKGIKKLYNYMPLNTSHTEHDSILCIQFVLCIDYQLMK